MRGFADVWANRKPLKILSNWFLHQTLKEVTTEENLTVEWNLNLNFQPLTQTLKIFFVYKKISSNFNWNCSPAARSFVLRLFTRKLTLRFSKKSVINSESNRREMVFTQVLLRSSRSFIGKIPVGSQFTNNVRCFSMTLVNHTGEDGIRRSIKPWSWMITPAIKLT